jgi:mono/diheme cytochrome c family protein
MKKILTSFLLFLLFTVSMYADNGKKVFETYCWGCHHQTAMAFGPSFATIASQRTAEEIEAMMTDPEGVSKVFGYKRNAMPALKLKPEELKAITAYILSFKDVSDEENKTIIEEPYPNMAAAKERH